MNKIKMKQLVAELLERDYSPQITERPSGNYTVIVGMEVGVSPSILTQVEQTIGVSCKCRLLEFE